MSIVRKRYRVLVDIDVDMRAIDPINAARNWRRLMEPGPEHFSDLGVSQTDYIARQQRLLDTLLRDDTTLDAWLGAEVARVVAEGWDLEAFVSQELAHEILAPVIPELVPPEHLFSGDVAEDEFYEMAEPFFAATTAEIVSMSIERVRRPPMRDVHLYVEQRYRAVVEVDARIGDIDAIVPEQEHIELGAPVSDDSERLRKLVDAVLQNEAVLDAWLRHRIMEQMEDSGARHLWVCIPDQEILRPVIERMSAEDQEYLRRAVAGDVLYDALEEFHRALTSEVVSVAFVEAPEAAHA